MIDKVSTHILTSFDKAAKKALKEAQTEVSDKIQKNADPMGCYTAEKPILHPELQEEIGKVYYDYRVSEFEFGVCFFKDDGTGKESEEDFRLSFLKPRKGKVQRV